MKFFKSSDRQYLMDIKTDNSKFYKYNLEFIAKITEEKEYKLFVSHLPFSLKFADMVANVNSFLASYLYDSDDYTKITYRVVSYILKTELDFNIELMTKDRSCLSIIQYRLAYLSSFSDIVLGDSGFDYMLRNKISISKDILNELINILYLPLNDDSNIENVKTKEEFRNRVLFNADILVNELIIMYHARKLNVSNLSPISSMISDNKLYAIVENRLETIMKKESEKENKAKQIKCIGKLTKKQFNVLFKGLVELDCLDEECRVDLQNFMGLNDSQNILINTVKWKKSKGLAAFFVDSFNKDILKLERNEWRSFEKLFDLKKLANTKNDYDKTGINPCGDVGITKLIIKVLKA